MSAWLSSAHIHCALWVPVITTHSFGCAWKMKTDTSCAGELCIQRNRDGHPCLQLPPSRRNALGRRMPRQENKGLERREVGVSATLIRWKQEVWARPESGRVWDTWSRRLPFTLCGVCVCVCVFAWNRQKPSGSSNEKSQHLQGQDHIKIVWNSKTFSFDLCLDVSRVAVWLCK